MRHLRRENVGTGPWPILSSRKVFAHRVVLVSKYDAEIYSLKLSSLSRLLTRQKDHLPFLGWGFSAPITMYEEDGELVSLVFLNQTSREHWDLVFLRVRDLELTTEECTLAPVDDVCHMPSKH